MSGLFTIGEIEAPENSKNEGLLKVLELNDGSDVNIPVVIVNGAKPGPTVFIGAGAHGDEINGIRSVINAASELNPTELNGIVIAVPVQNTLAYRDRQRLIALNQLDQLNMHRTFPGDPEGDPCSQIAYFILNYLILQTGVAFVIDMHTGNTGSFCPPHTFVPSKKYGDVAEKSRAAATAFNAGILLQAEAATGVYAHGGMLHMVVAEHGIPSLGCEIGRGLTVEKKYIEVGTRGILNVLQHLQMLDATTPIKTYNQVVVNKITSVRAHRGGLCCLEVKPGDLLKKGGLIATITDLFGKKVEECVSPIEGYAITLTAFPAVHQGERIARIAAPEE